MAENGGNLEVSNNGLFMSFGHSLVAARLRRHLGVLNAFSSLLSASIY